MRVRTKGGVMATRKGRVLRPVLDCLGYCRVTLCKNGKRENRRIHRMVAIVFIPNPRGYNIINHKDRNPRNNAIDNLEWCSISYNVTYDNARARSSRTRYNNMYGFKRVAQYDLTGRLITTFESSASAARAIGCSQGSISNSCTGRAKTAGGYKWRYIMAQDLQKES